MREGRGEGGMDRGQRDGRRTEGRMEGGRKEGRDRGMEEGSSYLKKGVNPNGAPLPPHPHYLYTQLLATEKAFFALLALGDVPVVHPHSLIIILSSSKSAIFCWRLQEEDQSL